MPPNQADKVAQELAVSRVSQINFPPNQKAAIDLQKNFVGSRVEKQDMLDALNDWGNLRLPPARLLGNTWLAEGVYGRIVYDDLGSGECIVQAIEPRIGQEVKLVSGLDQKVGEKEKKKEKLTQVQKTKKLIDKKLLSPISSIGNARLGEWMQNIKDPNRQKAAVELQENYTGFRLEKSNLPGVLNPSNLCWDNRVYPERLSGKTYQVRGALGQLFYDDLGNGQIAIRGIRPTLGLFYDDFEGQIRPTSTLGRETQLRDGLRKRKISGKN